MELNMNAELSAAPTKPLLYRAELTELYKRNNLPALTLNYLNKIASLGEGPPFAIIFNRRPVYDPDEALAWLRARVEEQTRAARERQENSLQWRKKRLERLKAQSEAVRESSAA
jgi:hypothetical protein